MRLRIGNFRYSARHIDRLTDVVYMYGKTNERKNKFSFSINKWENFRLVCAVTYIDTHIWCGYLRLHITMRFVYEMVAYVFTTLRYFKYCRSNRHIVPTENTLFVKTRPPSLLVARRSQSFRSCWYIKHISKESGQHNTNCMCYMYGKLVDEEENQCF